MPNAAACRERCFDSVREVLNAMKVIRTLLCERESLTADVVALVPICTHSAKETLGMWLEDMAEMFEGGLQSEEDVEAEGGVSDTSHNFCVFNLVDPACSHMLVSVCIRSKHLYTSSAHMQPTMILTVVVGSR